MYYVYILKSLKDNKFYTGFSKDLRRRVAAHNAGLNTSTAKRAPLVLIYYEAYRNEKDARLREHFLKTGKGRENIKDQIKHSIIEEV